MDYSFRTLQKNTGSDRERKNNSANHKKEDLSATVMRTVRVIIQET